MNAQLAQEECLSISIEREGRTARITVRGEVDLTAYEAMLAAAARIHPAHDRVIIDLSTVTFIDARGFAHVLATRDALAATGCHVELGTTGMSALMLEVVQVTQRC